MMIVPADNILNEESYLQDFFPKQVSPNSQNFNDTTFPGATLGRIGSNFSNERPAHFALDGIQKLSNGNTVIDEIILNENLLPDTITIVRNYSSGYRTASVPLVSFNFSLQSVFPTAISAYLFGPGGYQQVSSLLNGFGYWVNFDTATQKTFTGYPLNYQEIPVAFGWNLTGTISSEISVANICSEPIGIIENIYGYENGYILMTGDSTLKPGKGYWTKTTNQGKIFLDKYAEPCEVSKIKSIPQINFSSMDKFIITDAEGYSQTLYVLNTDIDTVMQSIDLELPPFFSELDFDSRFEYSEYVKKVSADSGTIDLNILVHTNSLPVTLSWDLNPENGINYSFISDTSLGKISSIENLDGKVSFNKLINNKINLFASVDKINLSQNIPEEFSLEQNYPNPFNPITNIKFSVPMQSKIKLNLYNILGELVQTISEGLYEPGFYETVFDAKDLPSGIYIYRIESNQFIQSKKMILIK